MEIIQHSVCSYFNAHMQVSHVILHTFKQKRDSMNQCKTIYEAIILMSGDVMSPTDDDNEAFK